MLSLLFFYPVPLSAQTPTSIKQIKLVGNQYVAGNLLKDFLPDSLPCSLQKVHESAKNMLAFYGNNGFPFAQIHLDTLVDSIQTITITEHEFWRFQQLLVADSVMHPPTVQLLAHIQPKESFSLQQLDHYARFLRRIPSVQQAEFQPFPQGQLLAHITTRKKLRLEGALGLQDRELRGKMNLFAWNLFRRGHHLQLSYEQFSEDDQKMTTELFLASLFQRPVQGKIQLMRRQFYTEDLLELHFEVETASQYYQYALGFHAEIARIDSITTQKDIHSQLRFGWEKASTTASLATLFSLPDFRLEQLIFKLQSPNPLLSKWLEHYLQISGWQKLDQPLRHFWVLGGENMRSLPSAYFYAPQLLTLQNNLSLLRAAEATAGLFTDIAAARTTQQVRYYYGIGAFLSLGQPHWLHFSWGYSLKPRPKSFAETVLRIHISRDF